MIKPVMHVGVRPIHPIVRSTSKSDKQAFYERFPDGKFLRWTRRQLESGCNTIIEEKRGMGDLIFCPKCDEWFNEKQFEKVEGNDS